MAQAFTITMVSLGTSYPWLLIRVACMDLCGSSRGPGVCSRIVSLITALRYSIPVPARSCSPIMLPWSLLVLRACLTSRCSFCMAPLLRSSSAMAHSRTMIVASVPAPNKSCIKQSST